MLDLRIKRYLLGSRRSLKSLSITFVCLLLIIALIFYYANKKINLRGNTFPYLFYWDPVISSFFRLSRFRDSISSQTSWIYDSWTSLLRITWGYISRFGRRDRWYKFSKRISKSQIILKYYLFEFIQNYIILIFNLR
jgi:hypothetical protein